MPKFKEQPTSFLGWFFLVLFIGALIFLFYRIPYALLLIPIFIVFEIKDNKKRNTHFKEMLQNRQHESICTFSRYFECRKVDTWVIRAVYEQLQNHLDKKFCNFPIRPTDDVFTDLLIDDDDFQLDIVDEIAQRTGRTLDNAESNIYYEKANIVENLVYFFNEQPKTNEA